MDTFDAIISRRSIRKFKDKEIPIELIEKILQAASNAPSAKNRQPWKFFVVTNKNRSAMLEVIRTGIANEKSLEGLLPNSLQFISGAENTLKMMEQAPITVFVFNTEDNSLWNESGIERRLLDIANIQSIGAAIQNMLLAGTSLGIGSLWICDVFFAYREICQWLNEKNQLIAAVSFGYPDENPSPRPRKNISEIVQWL